MCKLFNSYEKRLHLGVCKLAKYVNGIFFGDFIISTPPPIKDAKLQLQLHTAALNKHTVEKHKSEKNQQ